MDDVRAQVSAEEWQTRVDVAAAFRLVAHFGWDDIIFTHISARVPGPDRHFLINPYELMFHEITASSLVKVDLDGAVVLPGAYSFNPAGFTIHSAIHAAREDAGCIIHLHTACGVGVSCQEAGLLPLSQTALVLGSVAYHDFQGIALNHDERPALVADLGAANVMMLRNHGTLAVGRSVPEAFRWIYNTERACAQQVAAQAGGGALRQPPAMAVATIREQARNRTGAAALMWPPLLRLLDARYPGFRD